MILDTSDFDKKFDLICKGIIPSRTKVGLVHAAQQAMIDADTIEPKTPHLEGNLRGSKKVGLVENSKKEFSIEFGFDQPYAGALHEREKPTNWSEEGVGPKYLQSKLARFMDKYKRIFGLAIKRGKK